ncbi:MAG: metallophosphoesterase [Thermoguttaceae bacterium]
MIAAVVLLSVAAAGHSAIWIAAVNRTHATGWPHAIIRLLTKLYFLLLLVPPPLVACWLFWVDPRSLMPWRVLVASGPQAPAIVIFSGYLTLCWFAAAAVLVRRLRHLTLQDVSTVLRFHRSRSLVTSGVLHSHDHAHHAMVHLPGNESLELDLTERGLDVPRLPPALEGLSIVHLSDFHFTGRVGKPFFEEIVRMSNSLEPEIVALTGDLIDKPPCIDWIPDTLGRLKARYGVYFIFGNHDLRVDWQRMRQVMEDHGLIYMGGHWKVIEVRGQPVLLAGNELPWFKPAADLSTCPPRSDVPFRLLLAHSPDQLPWARQGEGDILLAGHNHGGQIRLPLIGPVFSPSYGGVQYASGLFHTPPTILNVSRGLSAELPLRMNCTPEIVHLTLHTGRGQT